MSRLGRESRRLNPAENGSTGGVSGHGDCRPRNVRCGEFDRAHLSALLRPAPGNARSFEGGDSRDGCWHGAGLRQGQWARGVSEGHGYDDGSLLREENDVN
jgi:hypothetical protein